MTSQENIDKILSLVGRTITKVEVETKFELPVKLCLHSDDFMVSFTCESLENIANFIGVDIPKQSKIKLKTYERTYAQIIQH